MILGITGAVSTGKTTLSILYSKKHNFQYVDLKRIAEKNALLNEYDEERDAFIIDINELEKAFEEELSLMENKDIIVDSHLLVEQKFPLDKLIILRTSPLVLYERMLKTRNYSKKKAFENALAEALDYFSTTALKHYPSQIVYEINLTGKDALESLEMIEDVVSGKAKREYFSFPLELKELALLDRE